MCLVASCRSVLQRWAAFFFLRRSSLTPAILPYCIAYQQQNNVKCQLFIVISWLCLQMLITSVLNSSVDSPPGIPPCFSIIAIISSVILPPHNNGNADRYMASNNHQRHKAHQHKLCFFIIKYFYSPSSLHFLNLHYRFSAPYQSLAKSRFSC